MPTDLPALPDGLFYGQSGRMLHVWRHAPTARLPQRWESACGMTAQHEQPPLPVAGTGGVLCYGCRDARKLAAREAAETRAAVAEHQALVPAGDVVEGILVMTVAEARRAADAIKAAVEDLRVKIDEFDRGRGWQVLGYESFRAWAIAEIPDTSLRHVYRLRDAAKVDHDLGVTVGHTPETHARELKHVPPADRPAVVRQADERAASAGRERTAADVCDVARGVTVGHTPPASSPDAEVEALLAEVEALEARIAGGRAGPADAAALDRIAARADALGALNLGAHAAALREALDGDGPGDAPAAPPAWQVRLAEAEQRCNWAAIRIQDPLAAVALDAARALLQDVPNAAAQPVIGRIVDVGLQIAAAVGGAPVVAALMGDGWTLQGPDGGELYRCGQLAALLQRLQYLATRPVAPPPAEEPAEEEPDTEGWCYGRAATGEAVVAVDGAGLAPIVGAGIAAAAAALRALILGEPVDSAALDDLVEQLRDAGERAATLIAVIEEIASDADALVEREEEAS